jgi:hypothetical protein
MPRKILPLPMLPPMLQTRGLALRALDAEAPQKQNANAVSAIGASKREKSFARLFRLHASITPRFDIRY